jgi:hypothetical protein
VPATPRIGRRPLVAGLAAAAALAVGGAPRPARAAEPFRAGFAGWRAAQSGFADWQLDGAALGADGRLRLPPGLAEGVAVSQPVASAFGLLEAIPSWNADAPDGSQLAAGLRARVDGDWTPWYELGFWSASARGSVRGQRDELGAVETDTLALRRPADALQLRLRLSGDAVAVRAAAVAYSTRPTRPAAASPGDPAVWGRELDLPRCSQMVYPDGGRVWCSPTSTSMIVGYWLRDEAPCETRVRAAVEGVYDPTYRGHGNWPFNTAYAATHGLEGYVARLESLAHAEPWIAAGVPVAFSFAFRVGELPGAPIASTNGHLAVLVGFDPAGNPIVNDPAAPNDRSVRRVYRRAALEAAWLGASGGTVYLIHPPGWPTPPL